MTKLRTEQLRRGVEDPVGAFLSLLQDRGDAAAGPSGQPALGTNSLAEQLERELHAEYMKHKAK